VSGIIRNGSCGEDDIREADCYSDTGVFSHIYVLIAQWWNHSSERLRQDYQGKPLVGR